MHYDVEAEARLAWRSHAYFSDWERRVGGECGFTAVGFLQLVPPAEVPALRANTAMQQAVGIRTELVGADQPAGHLDSHHEGADLGLVVGKTPPVKADNLFFRDVFVASLDKARQLVADVESRMVAFEPLDGVAAIDELPVGRRPVSAAYARGKGGSHGILRCGG